MSLDFCCEFNLLIGKKILYTSTNAEVNSLIKASVDASNDSIKYQTLLKQ